MLVRCSCALRSPVPSHARLRSQMPTLPGPTSRGSRSRPHSPISSACRAPFSMRHGITYVYGYASLHRAHGKHVLLGVLSSQYRFPPSHFGYMNMCQICEWYICILCVYTSNIVYTPGIQSIISLFSLILVPRTIPERGPLVTDSWQAACVPSPISNTYENHYVGLCPLIVHSKTYDNEETKQRQSFESQSSGR